MKDREMVRIRRSLRALPARQAPPDLPMKLRVMASRESARRRAELACGGWLPHRIALIRQSIDNLLRPVAIPMAGGLLAAMLLFAIMAPGLTVNRIVHFDVPTALATEATVQKSASFDPGDEDIVVDVIIDEMGSVVDYSIPQGQRWFANPEIRKSVENALVCTRFAPATVFGHAITGKTRITFRRSHVEVKG
jgi:hypothetical protein